MSDYKEYVGFIVVGDYETSDKTSLLVTYVNGSYLGDNDRLFVDFLTVTVQVNGKNYAVGLADTSGTEDFENIRVSFYRERDVILLCYSVSNRTSFNNVKTKWMPEVKIHCPDATIILVGVDKRNIGETAYVTHAEGLALSRKLGIFFIECSIRTCKNIDTLFQIAVLAALEKRQPTSANSCLPCSIL